MWPEFGAFALNVGSFIMSHIADIGGWIAVLGVAGAVINWFVKWRTDRALEKLRSRLNADLETHKSTLNRETERLKGDISREADVHKLNLKKQELLFTKELEAAGAFMQLLRSIFPKVDYPEFDWDDACKHIARSFIQHERDLEKFEIAHGAVINAPVRTLIFKCKSICSVNKFNAYEDVAQLSSEANKKAGEMIDLLEKMRIDCFVQFAAGTIS